MTQVFYTVCRSHFRPFSDLSLISILAFRNYIIEKLFIFPSIQIKTKTEKEANLSFRGEMLNRAVGFSAARVENLCSVVLNHFVKLALSEGDWIPKKADILFEKEENRLKSEENNLLRKCASWEMGLFISVKSAAFLFLFTCCGRCERSDVRARRRTRNRILAPSTQTRVCF